MTSNDPRIDAYIAKSAEFARPILQHLRQCVHANCTAVEETIKWGMPFFSYNARPMCTMAAFKRHCSFSFWLAGEVIGSPTGEGMGQFGKLTSLHDLPTDARLARFLKKAMALNESGAKKSRAGTATKTAPALPVDLAAELLRTKHAVAREHWETFGSGAQREYIQWLTEAKTDATRHKRLATTLEWLAEGKKRNWKYEKC